MLSARSAGNVHDNFCAARWRDSNADPSLVWSWLLLLHAGGCHQVCHHDCHQADWEFSSVLGATSAILNCCSGCICCVIIPFQLRSFRFCYRELEHSKARAAREKEVVNTWIDDQSWWVFDHVCLIPNSSWTFRSLRTVTGLVPPSTLLASPWSLAGIINFFAV